MHEANFWDHEGNQAVKAGDWKLVSRYPELSALWTDWAKRSNVLPLSQVQAAMPKHAYKLHALLQRILMQLLGAAGYEYGGEFDFKARRDWQPRPDVAILPEGDERYPTKAPGKGEHRGTIVSCCAEL